MSGEEKCLLRISDDYRTIVYRRVIVHNGKQCKYDYCTIHECYRGQSLDSSWLHGVIGPTLGLDFSSMIRAASSSKYYASHDQSDAYAETIS